jgi:hypothetical protein
MPKKTDLKIKNTFSPFNTPVLGGYRVGTYTYAGKPQDSRETLQPCLQGFQN